ncbi:hypothetical protein SAMN00790413_06359 [Deinococcus hopiensis KR-140]|uniref:Uncharacterized protein n=1 Tax=Deinococcus hopiensis KR-140 TaxID=695939 RepID=A0A1W1VUU2_9DEIO|nr:hypothetical protein [Deinococcus hopiensis]SMB97129.1 hypothetical protein SAMN00790413_06359 [Deinococcus hopiensis KR-140]
MKTSSILNDQDKEVLTRSYTLSEGRHHGLISLLIQNRNQPESAFPALRVDESVDVESLVARVDRTD